MIAREALLRRPQMISGSQCMQYRQSAPNPPPPLRRLPPSPGPPPPRPTFLRLFRCRSHGTALRASYDRSLSAIANGTLFPPVPDDKTFIALGLNNRPTFFGCDPKNFTLKSNQVVPPLVVYVPNAPYTAMSNVTTFTPSYKLSERDAIIRNGYDAATQGDGTLDGQWRTCVACAVMSRSWARTNTATPAQCASCFERYCWNGTVAAGVASTGEYEPTFKIEDRSSAAPAVGAKAVGRVMWAVVVAGVVGMAMF